MPQRKPIPMTADGRAKLEAELKELVQERRPELVKLVATTRAEGDLKENFGYHDARQALGMLDGRVQTIEAMLRDAEIIEEAAPDGTVQLGSKVIVRDDFGDSEYTIVTAAEADVTKGMISMESPLGAALTGRTAGDEVSFETPAGERTARVVSVS